MSTRNARVILGMNILVLLFITQTCLSFNVYPIPSHFKKCTKLSESPLSSAEIADQAKEIKDSSSSSLFDESLIEDMTTCAKLLGKRVDNGPSSLSVEEVAEMSAGLQRIMNEMNGSGGSTTTSKVIDVIPTPVLTPPQSPKLSMPFPTSTSTPTSSKEVTDISDDEGPEFTGASGFGLATETTNTYVIDGMDAMSPEEYQKALQDTVSARQAQRKKALGSSIGNQQSQNYLDNLSGN